MKKSILIFGAGINQIELIREAKKISITTVVIDPFDNPPGKNEADFYYQVDGKDYETTKKIAIKHKVNGIVTGQMEKPMRLMAKLAQEMGYIFHSPEIVERTLHKALMKQAFNKYGIKCAKGIVFNEGEKVTVDKLQTLSFPVIIKPVDAFSSRGVLKADNIDKVLNYEQEARSYSQSSSIIVEEFLSGKEVSVESITYRGKTTVLQITEKFITPYPHTVEMAHLQPARISNNEKVLVKELVIKAFKALGIDNSASHAEVMLTKKGPYMIEIGARLGGDFIGSYLTKASTGVSMDKAAVQIALGIKPDLEIKANAFSMIKYNEFEKGKTIKKLPSLSEIKKMDGFVFAHYFLNEGDTVPEITHSGLRHACILFSMSNYNSLFKIINKAEERLKTKIELI